MTDKICKENTLNIAGYPVTLQKYVATEKNGKENTFNIIEIAGEKVEKIQGRYDNIGGLRQNSLQDVSDISQSLRLLILIYKINIYVSGFYRSLILFKGTTNKRSCATV